MSIRAPDLHRHAERLGVTLRRHSGGTPGWYDHHRRTISTRRGMGIAMYRSVLAHELGHAHFQDVAVHGIYTARQEARADLYAAHLLIDPEEFRDACIWHHDHLGAVADDLEVTHHLARVYAAHSLERTHP